MLEIGFGNGRTVPDVIAQAADVHYVGVDISPTMVAEATRFNAAMVTQGQVSFHLASAERLPFDDDAFDRIFSIGVIHFWLASGQPRSCPGVTLGLREDQCSRRPPAG